MRFFLKVNYRKDDSKKLFNNLSIEIKLFYGTTNAVLVHGYIDRARRTVDVTEMTYTQWLGFDWLKVRRIRLCLNYCRSRMYL